MLHKENILSVFAQPQDEISHLWSGQQFLTKWTGVFPPS